MNEEDPELKFGWKLFKKRLGKGDIRERESYFPKPCTTLDTLCEKIGFGTKLCAKPLKGKNLIISIFMFRLVVLVGISLEPRARLSETMWYSNLCIWSKFGTI